MPSIFGKLNLKAQKTILVVNAPASFEPELESLKKQVAIVREPKQCKKVEFALAFVTKQAEVNALTKQLVAQAHGDALLWFAYPKGTSKKYQCEFNRDNGWDALKAAGFDTVRAVAIDEDWSALRFRRVEFIKAS